MSAIPPIKGQKVLLRGFDTASDADARTMLLSQGYKVVNSLAQADILITGSGNASAAVEAANKSKIVVTPWSEFSSGIQAPAQTSAPTDNEQFLPSVDVRPDSVRILDQVLPRVRTNSTLVPGADQFRHICKDECFLRNARAVALGVRLGMPVALEGETAVSKTTSILWVAHLIGQPVVRLNLTGQSDTGELIGRYVPSTARNTPGRHQHTIDEAVGSYSGLLHTSAEPANWMKLGPQPAGERSTAPGWIFKEGYVPQAMRQGWWVILDEMNLAEPQVLERLNPVIEQPPSLVMSESDGTIFGSSGRVRIAPGFHMFATLNPADYAGRSVLSPAFRDRWLVWHQAASPGESEFAAMLRCLVLGEHPDVSFNGKHYRSASAQPIYPELGNIPGISTTLQRLALFHSSLSQAGGMGGGAATLGRLRRERYVFTRRSLLACLQILGQSRVDAPEVPFSTHLREAIEVAYLDRMREGADRNGAVALLRAAGLGDH